MATVGLLAAAIVAAATVVTFVGLNARRQDLGSAHAMVHAG